MLIFQLKHMTHFAFPHIFGSTLTIMDPDSFNTNYNNQATMDDEFVLMTPSNGTLLVWAQSCLRLGDFEGMHRIGGWSPFRSGEVPSRNHNDVKQTFFYKLGDDGVYDFKSATDGRKVSIMPWLQTVSLFAKLALNLYILKCEEDISCHPHLVVRKMLHSEWGESDDIFTSLLRQKGFDPKILDQMVIDAWQKMIKLPLPTVFSYIHDEDVRLKIVEMSETALRK